MTKPNPAGVVCGKNLLLKEILAKGDGCQIAGSVLHRDRWKLGDYADEQDLDPAPELTKSQSLLDRCSARLL